MPLADLQRDLAASLAAGARHAPKGLNAAALGRARRALEAKRRRAARHLLPRLHAALGDRWEGRFHAHASRYTPAGLLHRVDDAWEMAEAISREDRSLWNAAQDDLLALKLRWTRDRKEDAGRIRERRGLVVAIRRGPPRRLVVRLPGIRGKTLSLRLRLSGVADLLHSGGEGDGEVGVRFSGRGAANFLPRGARTRVSPSRRGKPAANQPV